jgi:hypothetical protein
VLLLSLSDRLANSNLEADKPMPGWLVMICAAVSVLTAVAMWRNRVPDAASQPVASPAETFETSEVDPFEAESMTTDLTYRLAVGMGTVFLAIFVVSMASSLKSPDAGVDEPTPFQQHDQQPHAQQPSDEQPDAPKQNAPKAASSG